MADKIKSIECINSIGEGSIKLIDDPLFQNPLSPPISIPTNLMNVKNTAVHKIQTQNEEILDAQKEQNELLSEQNQFLKDNNEKLKSLLKTKANELNQAQKEAKKAKLFNIIMLIIAIVSMIVAVLAWIFPRDSRNTEMNNTYSAESTEGSSSVISVSEREEKASTLSSEIDTVKNEEPKSNVPEEAVTETAFIETDNDVEEVET